MTPLARVTMFALLASTLMLYARVREQDDLIERANAGMADLAAADTRLKAATDDLFRADQHLQSSCRTLIQAMGKPVPLDITCALPHSCSLEVRQ